MMIKISVYTRDISNDDYPFGLATAVHFSAHIGGETVRMNRNYGILFAQGEISGDNTIIPLGIADPRIYRLPDGSVGISGRRITESGKTYESDEGKVWSWKTNDLIHFETLELVEESRLIGYNTGETLDMDEDIVRSAFVFLGSGYSFTG